MSASLLFVVSTVATWLGAALLLVGAARFVSWCLAPSAGRDPLTLRGALMAAGAGAVGLAVGAGVPHDLGRPSPEGLWIPVVWPVMPFPYWIGLVCTFATVARGLQAAVAVTPVDRAARLKAAGGWLLALVGCAVWAKVLGIVPELLRGAAPARPDALVAVAVLFVVAVAAVRLSATAFRLKGLGNRAAVVLGLVLGSAVFTVPLVWLLLTSFKEQQDNAGDSLVWVPRVTRQHPYFDPERPLVKTRWRDMEVTAAVVRRDGGRLQLDVERPYPFRGWRIETAESDTKPEPRQGAVVTTSYQGRQVEGFVRKESAGGGRTVEILAPPDLKGTVFETTAQQTEPVRDVGACWANYAEALEWLPPETAHGLVYVRNSLWLVLMSVVGTLLSCSLVAYGMSRVRFPGRKALFGLMIATMMLPAAVTMLPRFLVWRSLGAVDTLVPVWLPSFTAATFYVFLLRQFFRTLPAELEDAAKIDGCGPLRTYWRVMLPQVKPALAVIGVWTFMGVWNDFMSPLIYVSSSDKMPVSYALQLFSADKSGDFGMLTAFATMATVPVLIVFLLGQRYLVEGVQLSGLGGK